MTADELRVYAMEAMRATQNEHTRRIYQYQAGKLCRWYEDTGRTGIDERVISDYADYLLQTSNTVAPINQGLLILVKVTRWLADHGIVDGNTAYFATTMTRLRQEQPHPRRWDNETLKSLINAPDAATAKGARDRAIMAVLFGCGLQRGECARLRYDQLQAGQLTNVIVKYGKVKTVALPGWVSEALDWWLSESGITSGPLFPGFYRGQSSLRSAPMSSQSIYDLVCFYANQIGIEVTPRELSSAQMNLSKQDAATLRDEIAKLNREIASLRRALNLKANLTTDRLRGAVVEHWERRDVDQP